MPQTIAPQMAAPAKSFPHPTCVGYCRVSTAEQAQHGWSLQEQEESIRAWASAHGLELVAVFRDSGRSGRSMHRRPGLLGLLELTHHGGIGVVVAKAQDRLARAVDHAIGLRRWIHQHGADLLFLNGDIHLRAADVGRGTNLGGELISSLNAILAEDEINTLRRRIIPGLAQAARHGRRGGRLPLGYQRQTDGSIVVESHDADLIQQAVQAVLAGSGLSGLVRTWVAAHIRDHRGEFITFDRLRGALLNPFLMGELRYRLPAQAVGSDGASEIRIPSHHQALLDPVSFNRVRVLLQKRGPTIPSSDPQAERRERRRVQRRSNRLPASGDLINALRPQGRPIHGAIPPEILRCGTCGGPMYASQMTVGGRSNRGKRAVYLCRYHKDRGAAFCSQPPVPTETVDERVFEVVRGALRSWSLSSDEPLPADSASTSVSMSASPTAELAQAEAQRDRLLASMKSLGDHAPAALKERLATAESEVTRWATLAQRRLMTQTQPAGSTWAFLRQPQATWETLDTAGRRQVIAPILTRVVVRQKSVVTIWMRNRQGITESVLGSEAVS